MNHALIRLREERRILIDVYRDLKVGVLLYPGERDILMRQTRREIRETEMGIAILERADAAIGEAVKPLPLAPGSTAERPALHA